MMLQNVQGWVRRRVLINFRVDPDVIARQLPAPFRPKLIDDRAMAGVCLIRLEQLRPRGVPPALGVSSENAAHRIAVSWIDPSCWLDACIARLTCRLVGAVRRL